MAEHLAGRGDTLPSYTSVPCTGFAAVNNRFKAEDETEGVLALCQRHPNIRPTFCPLDGVDALSDVEAILDWYEIPFTTAPNMAWLYALAGLAHQEGGRLLLNGQMGNSTISWGNIYDLATSLLYSGHAMRALGVISGYGRLTGLSRKMLLKGWLAGLWPRLMGIKHPSPAQLLEETLVNPALAVRHKSAERNKAK